MSNPRYYLTEGNLKTPIFKGGTAKLLGIEDQQVSEDQFLSLFDGYLKDGDASIRLPKYIHPDRRGAWELTINQPKCVSGVALVGRDTRVIELHERVVDMIGRYVEENAYVRATKKTDDERYVHTNNLLYVPHHHYDNRDGEFHLHTHLLFFNLSHDKKTRTWKAVELGHIDQPAIGELYKREMMKGLRQLGYKVREKGKQFELIGFPAEVKARFSSGHNRVKELEAEYDAKAVAAGNKVMGQKERSKLSLYERPEKTIVALETRFKNWVESLTEKQFNTIKGLVRRAKQAVIDRWSGGPSRQHGMSREQGLEHERV